jgi:hypothetical protein
VVYLNQTPYQPRERDYAYAGSFYAFCIWIGVGVGGILRALQRLKLPDTAAAALATALCLLVPLQMVSQTWDDHDRSGRFIARDLGMNYLTTCEPNAIIFTNGDNDTFPLWYAQEVEGYRPDVRVCNLSYLQTDWYISQMKRQAYDSDPLPIDWKAYEYAEGKHNAAYVFDAYDEMWVSEVMRRIKSENKHDKEVPGYNVGDVDNIPTHKIKIPVDADAVIAAGLATPEDRAWIPPYMLVDLGEKRNEKDEVTVAAKPYLGKHELMVLNMLQNNADWKRPIYFASTVGQEMYMRLDPYLRRDGIALRVVPYETATFPSTPTDTLYNNIMNRYKYGNMEKEGLYLDENNIRMATSFRMLQAHLAQLLANQGDSLRAAQVADHSLRTIPAYNVPLDYFRGGSDLADTYHKIGSSEKADELYQQLADISLKHLKWYNRMNHRHYVSVLRDVRLHIIYMQDILFYFSENNNDLFNRYSDEFAQSVERFNQTVGANRPAGLNQ